MNLPASPRSPVAEPTAKLPRRLSWRQRLRRRTPLGWLQLSHEKGRLAVAVSGVAFADILMLMQLGFQGALFQSAVRLHETLNADIVLASPQMRNMMNTDQFSRRRLYQALDVPGVASVDPLYVVMANWKHPTTHKQGTMLLLGMNPSRQLVNRPDINRHLDRLKIPNTLLFDQKARGDYRAALTAYAQGQPLTTEIKGQQQHIRGLFEIGSSFGADGSLVTSTETFLRLYPQRGAGSVSLGLIKLKPGADLAATTAAIRQYLPDDVKVYTLAEFVEFEKTIGRPIPRSGLFFAWVWAWGLWWA